MRRERAQPLFVFRGHQASVNSVSFFADDLYLVSGDQDGHLIVWNMLLKRQLVKIDKAHMDPVVAVKGVGQAMVISQGRDSKLCIWELKVDSQLQRAELLLKKTLTVDSMSFCKFAFNQNISDQQRWIAGLEDAGTGRAFVYSIKDDKKYIIDAGRKTKAQNPTEAASMGSREDSITCIKLVVCDTETQGQLMMLVGYESAALQCICIDTIDSVHVSKTHSIQTAHQEPIMDLAYGFKHRCIHTCAADDKVCCYGIDQADGFQELYPPVRMKNKGGAAIQALHCTKSSSLVLVAGWDYSVHVLAKDTEVSCIAYHRAALTATDISTLSTNDKYLEANIPDELARERWCRRSRWLVVASRDGRMSLWDIDAIVESHV